MNFINCPVCDNEFDEYGEHPHAGRCIYHCPHCGADHFIYSDSWELENLFEPSVEGRTVQTIVRWNDAIPTYRLAELSDQDELAWFVYVARQGMLMAWTSAGWEHPTPEAHSGPRGKSTSIPRKNARPKKIALSRLMGFAWHGLSKRPHALAGHLNDDRTSESADSIALTSHKDNMKSFHEARRSGKLPEDQLVYPIGIKRSILERLRQLTSSRGKKLEAYVNHILEIEIRRLLTDGFDWAG